MRVRKGTRQHYDYLSLVEPEVQKFISSYDDNFKMERGVVRRLVLHAVQPSWMLKLPEYQSEFTEIYMKHPDFVVDFIRFVRDQFARTDLQFRVQRWLCENMFCRDSFGRLTASCFVAAKEIADATGTKATETTVRKAESLLLKRASQPVPWFASLRAISKPAKSKRGKPSK